MSLLAVIPARAGSKRLPNKNLRLLGGKPLIAWSIEAALESKSIDKVIVSTDDAQIAEVSLNYGAEVPFLRAAELATDTASSVDTVLDAVLRFPVFKEAILLQPTSPFRTAKHIDSAYELFKESGSSGVISVRTLHERPNWLYTQLENGHLKRLLSDDKCSGEVLALNGAIYIFNTKNLIDNLSFISAETIPFHMDEISSLDIDTLHDFKIAEYFVTECQKSKPGL